MPRSRRLRDRLTLAVFLLGLLTGLYAWAVEPYWLEISRHAVRAPLQSPLKIAHLTDLHTYGLGRRERNLLAVLEREKPDAIVLTGDSVIDGDLFGPALGLREDPSYSRAADVLVRLHAPLGVWMVRGNWEEVRQIPGERSYYERNGARLLVNDARELRPGIWLVGLSDSLPDVERTARHVPSDVFVIALFHSPAHFGLIAGKWPIALAGHTHGGQVRLPLLPPLWLPAGSGRYVSGWYDSRGSNLYVSRGIGTAMLPVRFLCRPELAIITFGSPTPQPQ